MNPGRVYLIGAGCGRADLLTLRGKNRLEHCDAVVYDDLIDPAILDLAPPDAQRIYMGKREGRHSAKQEEISAKLIELAASGLTVARLKGGDPFVFGRGGEEILALQRASIPFEVVPGITSAIAIPAGAGIPVTHRGVSRSFHVITGHTADTPDALPAELPQLAQCGGTLVILMGLSRLELIAQKLMEYGKSPETPAAVISGGNSPNPAVVRGRLADIAEKAQHILPPAVIVVGETAALDLSPTLQLPLAGVHVGVTGTQRMISNLTPELEALGARVVPLAGTKIQLLPSDPRLQELTSPEPKWLVFTSPVGVSLFFEQLRALRTDLRKLASCRFAVIGPATASALEERGIIPDLCPKEHTSAALADALIQTAANHEPIFLLRSAKGSPILRQRPEQVGFSVTDIPLYDTVPDDECRKSDRSTLQALDYLIFSSAGGTAEFFRQYGALPVNAVPVCIGPVTAAELAKYTDRTPLMAQDAGISHLIQAILSQKM